MAKEDLIPFKKGEDPRRNVTGANRGSKWLTTKLDEALRRIGDGNSEPYDVMLIKRLMKKAIVDGDMRAVELIWDRLEGKAPQEVKLDASVEAQLPAGLLKLANELVAIQRGTPGSK